MTEPTPTEAENADPAFTVGMIRLAASTYNIEPVKHG